jgi:hypothetical protein
MLVLNIASMVILGAFSYLVINPLVAIGGTIFGFFLPMLM